MKKKLVMEIDGSVAPVKYLWIRPKSTGYRSFQSNRFFKNRLNFFHNLAGSFGVLMLRSKKNYKNMLIAFDLRQTVRLPRPRLQFFSNFCPFCTGYICSKLNFQSYSHNFFISEILKSSIWLCALKVISICTKLCQPFFWQISNSEFLELLKKFEHRTLFGQKLLPKF